MLIREVSQELLHNLDLLERALITF